MHQFYIKWASRYMFVECIHCKDEIGSLYQRYVIAKVALGLE